MVLYGPDILIIRPYAYHSSVIHRVEDLPRCDKSPVTSLCRSCQDLLESGIGTHATCEGDMADLILFCGLYQLGREDICDSNLSRIGDPFSIRFCEVSE